MYSKLDRRPQRGFSLIELMIVVAIVAILASISVTAYRRYALRANRTEARIALLAIQAAQEKFFLQQNGYATTMAVVMAAPPNGLGVNLVGSGDTPSGNFTITLQNATANTYTAVATAKGAQLQDDTNCRAFSISESGLRLPADSTGCWR